jgi:peptidyl-dipeptidase Dcp
LGYTTHAHFVLEERMAESPEKCYSLTYLLQNKTSRSKEFADLQAFKETDGSNN